MSVWVQRFSPTSAFLAFHAFFFFSPRVSALRDKCTVHDCSCDVHVPFMHCSQDPQPLSSNNNNKNESHSTIHTFKNYFATVFSVFSKISCIQTDSKSMTDLKEEKKKSKPKSTKKKVLLIYL